MTAEVVKVKEPRSKFTALYIEPLCMKKINYYTQAADGEVSGLGTLVKDEQGRFIVKEVFLLEQECTAADTDIKPEAISKLMVDMMRDNKDPSQLKFWWHSHVNMGVFWSGTDETACETLSREFAFSLVVNKRRESLCRLDLYQPFRITFDGVKVIELPEAQDQALIDACTAEVKEKVKPPTYNHGNSYAGYKPGSTFQRDDPACWSPEYDGYEGYVPGGAYRGYKPRGADQRYSLYRNDKSKNIKLSEIVVEDIERLLDLAELHQSEGGMFCVETWDAYIHETLKAVAELRLTPKAQCKNPLTWTHTYPDCVNGKCRVTKSCKYWTKVFKETEADAVKELAELEASPGDIPVNEDNTEITTAPVDYAPPAIAHG